MSAAALPLAPPPDRPDADQCVVLRGVGWRQYEELLAARGDDDRPRYAYLRGTLWIMSPSKEHESISRMFHNLLTAYAEERTVDLRAFGAWTLKRAPDRGAEADESYVIGAERRDVPHLVVEVVWGSDLGEKLEVYSGLGVPEVWVWQRGSVEVHVFGLEVELAGLDLGQIQDLVDELQQKAAGAQDAS